MVESPRNVVLFAIGILAAVVAAAAGVYYVVDSVYPSVFAGTLWIRVLLTAVFGLIAVLGIERLLTRLISSRSAPRWGGVIISAYRFAAYAALAFAILLSANVNSIGLLAGGTFAGLVLGLASQTALSNIISGVVLLSAHPMQPGDRVTIVTWQFGVDIPAYPPKFYSQDFLFPGYTGIVRSLGIVYSSVVLDEGPIVQIPNSILLQAAVLTHEVGQRWVRAKFDVPTTIDVRPLLEQIRQRIAGNPWVKDPQSVRVLVNQATATVFVLSVDALCRGAFEDGPRSAILLEISDIVRVAKEGTAATRLPGPTPG